MQLEKSQEKLIELIKGPAPAAIITVAKTRSNIVIVMGSPVSTMTKLVLGSSNHKVSAVRRARCKLFANVLFSLCEVFKCIDIEKCKAVRIVTINFFRRQQADLNLRKP